MHGVLFSGYICHKLIAMLAPNLYSIGSPGSYTMHCCVSCMIYITNPPPDLPKVNFVEEHLKYERGNNINVTVQFVIFGSDNQTAKSDFEMELTETGMYV